MMFLKRKNGFTLFELIVTIAVIGIIAVLAVPSFKNLMASQEAKKNVRILNSVIHRKVTICYTSYKYRTLLRR